MKLIKYFQNVEYKIRIGWGFYPIKTEKLYGSFICKTIEEIECEIKRIESKTGGPVHIESIENIL